MLSSVNKFLLLLRFILCCLPLPGYIHPDEFFQSPEVAANDVLGVNTTRTWEWDGNFPARSCIFPMLSSGLPFLLLKLIKSLLGTSYTSYVLLVLPRIWMTLLSYVIDITIEKIFQSIYRDQHHKFQERKQICTFLFRSSGVTIVFFTRTFSNTIETILFTLFIWKIVSQANQDSFSKGLNTSTATVAFIVIIGFFIRPTFLLFAAFGSLVYIILCGKNGKLLSQTAIAFVTATITSSLIIFIDSKYFSTADNIKLIITPFNLIKYNLNEANLALHGEHPRFLHLVVNCPLLFGPLFGVLILSTAEIVLLSYNKPKERKWEFNLIFLVASTWLPIFMLSYFKHQEPRYILPTISTMSLVAGWTLERRPILWKKLVRFWITFNIALIAWFGFVHQGGIMPCLSHLNKEINFGKTAPKSGSCVKYDVMLWYTYMAPQHLIPIEKNAKTEQISLHNLGSIPKHDVAKLMKSITSTEEDSTRKCNQKVVFLCLDIIFLTRLIFS